MEALYVIVIILTLIAAVLLIGVVLIQKSKGGGLSSTFAGSNQIMGVRRTNDFIEKLTWYLACAVAVLAILSVFCAPSLTKSTGAPRVSVPTEVPAAVDFSTPAPAAEETPAPAAEETEAPAPAAEEAE